MHRAIDVSYRVPYYQLRYQTNYSSGSPFPCSLGHSVHKFYSNCVSRNPGFRCLLSGLLNLISSVTKISKYNFNNFSFSFLFSPTYEHTIDVEFTSGVTESAVWFQINVFNCFIFQTKLYVLKSVISLLHPRRSLFIYCCSTKAHIQ